MLLLIYLLGCVMSFGAVNKMLYDWEKEWFNFGYNTLWEDLGSDVGSLFFLILFVVCSWVGMFTCLIYTGSFGFRFNTRWVALLLLFVSAENYAQKIPYTFPIDTSENVNGFTTTDGDNYYVLKERIGDDCLRCLGRQPDLLLRSEALNTLEDLRQQLISAQKRENQERKKELNHCLQQREEYKRNYELEQVLTKDLESKLTHYKKAYRKEKAKRWFGIIGAAIGAAGTTYILTR